jgi:TatD DNase family protein
MIDAHAHLNATYSPATVEPVIDRFIKLGGEKIVDVTTCYKDFEISQSLIAKFPKVIFSTIGVHPESPDGTEETWRRVIEDFTKQEVAIKAAKNIVGIGETGLDFSFFEKFGEVHGKVIAQQRELFRLHVELAQKLQLPLVIHARGKNLLDYSPYGEILGILDELAVTVPIYLHSFAGDADLAKKATSRGYYLGINGIATYSNTQVLAEVVEQMPSELFVLETDSPFLVPSNLDRKELGEPKTNEPMGIFWTAKRVAKIRNTTPEAILAQSAVNAIRLFSRL